MANTTRLKYKENGSCSWCPRPRYINNGHTYALCEKHQVASKKYQATRLERPKIGLCRRCRNYAEYGRTLCEYHLDYEQKRIAKTLDCGDFMI